MPKLQLNLIAFVSNQSISKPNRQRMCRINYRYLEIVRERDTVREEQGYGTPEWYFPARGPY